MINSDEPPIVLMDISLQKRPRLKYWRVCSAIAVQYLYIDWNMGNSARIAMEIRLCGGFIDVKYQGP